MTDEVDKSQEIEIRILEKRDIYKVKSKDLFKLSEEKKVILEKMKKREKRYNELKKKKFLTELEREELRMLKIVFEELPEEKKEKTNT